MTDKAELLRLAESVEAAYHYSDPEDHQQCDDLRESAAVLRKLAEQEPVAWRWLNTGNFRLKLPKEADKSDWNPIYAAPVPRGE